MLTLADVDRHRKLKTVALKGEAVLGPTLFLLSVWPQLMSANGDREVFGLAELKNTILRTIKIFALYLIKIVINNHFRIECRQLSYSIGSRPRIFPHEVSSIPAKSKTLISR